MSARILNCSDVDYFNDPCAMPSLSKSIATVIVGKSPLHGWAMHPRLGGIKKTASQVQNDGHVMHKLLLGKGTEIVVIEADSFRTDRAKDLRDAAFEANQVPVLRHKFEEAVVAASKMTDAFRSLGYEFTGESEVAAEWTELVDRQPVLCRCKFDHVFIKEGVIYDFKKVRSANPDDVTRSMEEYGLDIQFVAYRRALRALAPQLTTEPSLVYLCGEIEPPYAVSHIEPDSVWEEIGVLRWERALRTWRECLAKNFWPGYAGEQPSIVTPPRWVRTKHLGDDYDMGDVGLDAS